MRCLETIGSLFLPTLLKTRLIYKLSREMSEMNNAFLCDILFDVSCAFSDQLGDRLTMLIRIMAISLS